MKFILFSLLLGCSLAIAEVSTDQVEAMIHQMVRDNVISKAEAEKAITKMKLMGKDQWSELNQKAATVALRVPASESPMASADALALDLNGAQFKEIEKEVKKIVPESR